MLIIKAKVREEQGKSVNRRLRKANKIPAIIYGKKEPSILIELDQDSITSMQSKSEFYNNPLLIVVNNCEIKVKVQAIQRHPFKPKLQHIDFILS